MHILSITMMPFIATSSKWQVDKEAKSVMFLNELTLLAFAESADHLFCPQKEFTLSCTNVLLLLVLCACSHTTLIKLEKHFSRCWPSVIYVAISKASNVVE